MKHPTKRGVTIVELTVVILILSILTSIAASVYIGHIKRAEYAVCAADIRNLEINAARYEADLGAYPLSSSGTNFGADAPNPAPDPIGGTNGCGYLMLGLLHSMSGNAMAPASPRWGGPYMDVDQQRLGDTTGAPITASTPLPSVCLLDPWGRPYQYVRSDDYALYQGSRKIDHPAAAAGEIYYNPSTVQIYSLGPNGVTANPPQAGIDKDDVSNFYINNN